MCTIRFAYLPWYPKAVSAVLLSLVSNLKHLDFQTDNSEIPPYKNASLFRRFFSRFASQRLANTVQLRKLQTLKGTDRTICLPSYFAMPELHTIEIGLEEDTLLYGHGPGVCDWYRYPFATISTLNIRATLHSGSANKLRSLLHMQLPSTSIKNVIVTFVRPPQQNFHGWFNGVGGPMRDSVFDTCAEPRGLEGCLENLQIYIDRDVLIFSPGPYITNNSPSLATFSKLHTLTVCEYVLLGFFFVSSWNEQMKLNWAALLPPNLHEITITKPTIQSISWLVDMTNQFHKLPSLKKINLVCAGTHWPFMRGDGDADNSTYLATVTAHGVDEYGLVTRDKDGKYMTRPQFFKHHVDGQVGQWCRAAGVDMRVFDLSED